MPCKKFISIRLQPGKTTRIYVDHVDVNNPHRTLDKLGKFFLQTSTGAGTESNRGTTVRVEPMRWPPPPYDAPIALYLNAQWPFQRDAYGTETYEGNDTAGAHSSRSYPGIEFVYDADAMTLSWNQKAYRGQVTGSVKFDSTSPVWNIVLALDPAAPNARGQLLIDGVDIT